MDHTVAPGGTNKQQHLQEDSLPPGFRFHPTDEELITYYLTHKISDANFSGRAITDVDLNKCEPWDLPAKAKMGEKEWYFFNLRDRKYPTGIRTNRATNAGYWKTTGKDKEIFNSNSNSNNDQLVGMKKTLVFYKGRAPRGEKTNWVMHEYRNQSKTTFRTTKDEWVVCRVFQKSAAGKKYPTHQPRANPYSFETGQGFPPPLMQPAESCHFPIGRNFVSNADLAELSRVLRGGSMGNLPMQTQFSYPSPSCFTISGLNLNLGSSSSSQPGFRDMPSASLYPPQTVDVNGDASSSVLTNQQGQVVGAEIGFGSVDMNSSNHNGGHNNTTNNNRFQQMEPCVDLDSYWPSY